MIKGSLLSLIIALMIQNTGNSASQPNYSGELTTEESLPLLKVLSKLGPLVVVKSSPFGQHLGLPHFCFMQPNERHTNLDLRSLHRAMAEFPSKAEWFVASDFPALCVLVQPKDRNYSGSVEAAIEFRGYVTKEIPRLSAWLEQRLSLGSAPSQGLGLQTVDLALEGINDHYEPHLNNVYIVADPQKFALDTTQATSPYDRLLHYGLSLQEMEVLKQFAIAHDPQPARWEILSRFWQEYTDQTVSPSEVLNLCEQCERLRETSQNPSLQRACDKVLSISASAARYNLGIFVESSE